MSMRKRKRVPAGDAETPGPDTDESRPPKKHEEAPGRNPAPTRPAGDEPPDGPLKPERENPDDQEA